jgi:hypothetical protein
MFFSHLVYNLIYIIKFEFLIIIRFFIVGDTARTLGDIARQTGGIDRGLVGIARTSGGAAR